VSEEKRRIHAPAGYTFLVGRGTMLVRKRSVAEKIEGALRLQFIRCGWPTHKLKVRQFGEKFFVNVGVRRGLDPDEVFRALQTLPRQCGQRRIGAVLDQLPQRVEPS
jgi:hypothetical protein